MIPKQDTGSIAIPVILAVVRWIFARRVMDMIVKLILNVSLFSTFRATSTHLATADHSASDESSTYIEIPEDEKEIEPLRDGDSRKVFLLVNMRKFRDGTNLSERTNAVKDHDNLIMLYSIFDYTIFNLEDLTKEQFVKKIKQLVNSRYFEDIESFEMFVGSHGFMKYGKTLINFNDGKTLDTEEIMECFSNGSCQHLKGKPKVFMFNCCRSFCNTLSRVYSFFISRPVWRSSTLNTLVCYSASSGQFSMGNGKRGSFFVDVLLKHFGDIANFDKNRRLEEYLPAVMREVIDNLSKEIHSVKKIEALQQQTPVMEDREFNIKGSQPHSTRK